MDSSFNKMGIQLRQVKTLEYRLYFSRQEYKESTKEDKAWEARFEAGKQNPLGLKHKSVHSFQAGLTTTAKREGFDRGQNL
jgi:hypothetical protein